MVSENFPKYLHPLFSLFLVFSIPTLPKPAHERKKAIEIVVSMSYSPSSPLSLRCSNRVGNLLGT